MSSFIGKSLLGFMKKQQTQNNAQNTNETPPNLNKSVTGGTTADTLIKEGGGSQE